MSLEVLGRALPGYELSEQCRGRCDGGASRLRWHDMSALRTSGDGSNSKVGVYLTTNGLSGAHVSSASIDDPAVHSADGLRPGLDVTFTFEPPLPRDETATYEGQASARRSTVPSLQGIACSASRYGARFEIHCPVAASSRLKAEFEKGPPPAPEGTWRLARFHYGDGRKVLK
jgi:hypothetical protein